MNTCNICNKNFTNKSKLVVHMRVHTREKPFSCDQCEKSFSTYGNLTEHKRIHTGEKPYSCDQCEKAFSQISNLTVHKRIHTGEKSFLCDLCDKHYTSSSQLSRHKKSPGHLEMMKSCNNTVSHTEEKPFSCDQCEKLFVRKNELISHKRIHTYEKLYSCDQCGLSFANKGCLTNHRKVHSDLVYHNKSTGHLEMIKSCNNTDPPSVSISLIKCEEVDVEKEIKEEEIFDEDPLSIQMRADNIEENIKQEIGDHLSCEQNYDEDRLDTIDIVHHKVEI